MPMSMSIVAKLQRLRLKKILIVTQTFGFTASFYAHRNIGVSHLVSKVPVAFVIRGICVGVGSAAIPRGMLGV